MTATRNVLTAVSHSTYQKAEIHISAQCPDTNLKAKALNEMKIRLGKINIQSKMN